MAQEILTDTQLRMTYDKGIDLDGNMVYGTKNYNNLKTAAATQGLFDVASALSGLCEHTLIEVERNSSYLISAT